MSEEKLAVEAVPPEELAHVPEHRDAGEPAVPHHGHFMGSGHNRLLLYPQDGHALVRALGTWDPMPWHVGQAYWIAGRAAQHAFWGQGNVERLSMLHQLARRIG